MSKTIKAVMLITVLVLSISLNSSYAMDRWCDHQGGILVSSIQTYTKVDDIKHKITNTVVRKCASCGQNYQVIDELGYEQHYCASQTDGGHGVGNTHYIKESCICSFFQLKPYTCSGPPCTTIDSIELIQMDFDINKSKIIDEVSLREDISIPIAILFENKLQSLKMKIVDFDDIFVETSDSDLSYFQDKLCYQQSLFLFSGRLPDSHKMNIDIISYNFNENTALVEVMETLEFQYINSEEPSFERLYYTIELTKKTGDSWLVTKVKCNDEFDEVFYESGFDLYSLQSDIKVAESIRDTINKTMLLENGPIDSNDSSDITQFGASAALSFTSYDANSAAAYAASYAINYNSNFASYNGVDCQNFASQCIWYGLGGSNIASSIINGNTPMVTSGTGQWYQKGPNGASEYSWVNVDGFASLINGSSSSRPGPQGSYTNSSYKTCNKGDLLEYYTTDSSNYKHVYFVYRVTGTSGNRTPSDIYVSAHTNDYHNKSFAEIWGANVSATKFRTIKITGAYN